MSSDADMERLKKASEALGEYFDTVQIFCTRHEPATEDGTVYSAWGAGNYFARVGQVSEWIVRQDENTRKSVREQE